MTAQEIRKKYLEFFKERGHEVISRSNLVPKEDPTTLFTGSGMQPLLPYLLGQPHPKGKRLADSQTCFRTEDIEEVGDNRHTTFFEMLGNWSLGDYFKAEQLPWFFEFLTDEVGLDLSKLYVTCFIGSSEFDISKDTESAEIWQQLFKAKGIEIKTADIGSEADGYKRGMKQGERIFFYDANKNWWSRTGTPENMPEGEPGGPDSEVFYDFGTEHNPEYGDHCHPNCDCGRFLEVGNSVFMQYVKTAKGFDELPQKNVDFGGGLERIAAASQNTPDVFRISLFEPIIKRLEKSSHKRYEDHPGAMRVITDHMRAAVWLSADGVVPSNNEQGYVMRRLIRRAVRFAFDLGLQGGLASLVVPIVVREYKDYFPEIADSQDEAVAIIEREERVFRQTLKKGTHTIEKKLQYTVNTGIVDKQQVGHTTDSYIVGNEALVMTGKDIFEMYDTYGFPVELSLEEAKNKGVKLAKDWKQEFDALMQKQRERSRTAAKGQFKGGLSGEGDMHKKYHTATHLMYRALRETLGDHVVQRGSNITDERLRFDFSHPEKMTDEEKKQVEDLVNERIKMNLKVSWKEVPTDKALKAGAYGAFGDTYGDTVKVYSMHDDKGNKYSFEICGGPHVENTGELAEGGKKFKIIKEESSSAGVRRIKAVLA